MNQLLLILGAGADRRVELSVSLVNMQQFGTGIFLGEAPGFLIQE